MKLILWLFALWLTIVTAAPAARKGGGLSVPKLSAPKGGAPKGGAPKGGKTKATVAKPPKSTKAKSTKAATASSKASLESTAKTSSTAVTSSSSKASITSSSKALTTSAASVSTSGKSASSSKASSTSHKSSTSSNSTSTASSSTTASSAINRAAWPTHPVDAGDIPTDKQLAAQKPFDTLKLPVLDSDYYAGPQVPSNFSSPTESHAQVVSDVASVQKPDNVGGKPLNVPQSKLGLQKRAGKAKPGAATGEPAQVFDPKGSLKPRCPKKFQDVVPFLNKPLQHEAMFYSAVNQAEYKFAEDKHLALVKPSLDPTYLIINDKCKNFWDLASQAWASVASGDVFVLLPDVKISAIDAKADKSSWPLPQWPAVRSGQTSIWEKIEWPQLKANSKVCRVWRVGLNSQPMLLMVRTGPQCSYVAKTP